MEFCSFSQDLHVKNPKLFKIDFNIYCVLTVDQVFFVKANTCVILQTIDERNHAWFNSNMLSLLAPKHAKRM